MRHARSFARHLRLPASKQRPCQKPLGSLVWTRVRTRVTRSIMASAGESYPASSISNTVLFTVSPSNGGDGPRLGTLSFPGRQKIYTPHYIAISSRGTVPHLSQDMMRGETSINGLYTALEDCKLCPYIPP